MKTAILIGILALLSLTNAVVYVDSSVAYVWVAGNSTDEPDCLTSINTIRGNSYGSVSGDRACLTEDDTRDIFGNGVTKIAITPAFVEDLGIPRRVVAIAPSPAILGKDDVFVFSIDGNHNPVFENSTTFEGWAGASDIIPFKTAQYPSGDGTFLVVMSCTNSGSGAGAIIHFDPNSLNYSLWNSLDDPTYLATFQPASGDYDYQRGLVVANFVDPLSLVITPPVYRNTLTHFNPDGSINATYAIPAPSYGPTSFNWHPTQLGGITQGTQFDNDMFWVDIRNHRVTTILTPSGYGVANGSPQGMFFSDGTGAKGTRYVYTFQSRYVVIANVDTTSPDTSDYKAQIIQAFDFCNPPSGTNVDFTQFCADNGNAVGTHGISYDSVSNRIIISNDDPIYQAASTKTLHAFAFSSNNAGIVYDNSFNPQVTGTGPTATANWQDYKRPDLIPSIYQLIFLAYPLGVFVCWILWNFWIKILGKDSPWNEEGSGVAVPPVFGWASLVNQVEWRIAAFIQSWFLIGGIAQAAFYRSGAHDNVSPEPLWALAAQIAFMIPYWIWGGSWSPIGFVARSIAIRFPTKPVPAQPRRLAAFLHVVMACVSYAMWWSLYWVPNQGAFPWMMIVFILILWIDAFFCWCPGCFIFAYFLAPHGAYLPSSLKAYHRIKGEEDYFGIYYRWIPYCFYKKIEFKGKSTVASGASKWRTHCENGICKLIRCDDSTGSSAV